jgi:hypothetical protein
MGCRGEESGQKKRFSDVLNLFGGRGIFFYVGGGLNNIVRGNEYVEIDSTTMWLEKIANSY